MAVDSARLRMKMFCVGVSAASLIMGSVVHAQQTKSTMQAYNNANIGANNAGRITGPIVNTLLNNMIVSMCGLGQASDCPLPLGYITGFGTGVSSVLANPTNTTGGMATIPVTAANVSSAASAYNVSGSNLSTTGTITAGQNSLTVANARDFVVNQGIRVNHAGAAFVLNPPTGGTVTPTGTTGATTYQYKIASIDANGGVGAAAAQFQTATGNATLTASNYNAITWVAATGTPPSGYAVYKNISGTFTLIGVTPDNTFNDYGFTSYSALDWIPATAQGASLADWLVTTVTAINGTTFTLAANATTTASSQFVIHDDTAQLSSYFTAKPDAYLPVGRYMLSGQINTPAFRDIRGASQYQTILTSAQATSYMLVLSFGSNVSNMTFQTPPRTAAIAANSVNSINVDGVTCQDGAIGGRESTCIALFSTSNVTATRTTLTSWTGIATGQATGGGMPIINVQGGSGNTFTGVIAYNGARTPIPNRATILLSDCFNCTVTNSYLNNEATNLSASSYGVEVVGGSQAVNIENNNILNFTDAVRSDVQTGAGILDVIINGNTLDFCVEACVLLNQGSWFTITGNSFVGETLANNYGIYASSSITNGPNSITGNTINGFNGASSKGMSLTTSLTQTVISDNVFTNTNSPAITGTSGNIVVHDNTGYNPVGVTSASYATATTVTYTAGASAETHYLTGGTVTAVKVPNNSGTSVCTTTPCTVNLGPGETMSVSYTVAPTDTKSVH